MLRTLTCAALAALPLLVSAGEPLTLDAALAEAMRASPDVAAARARLDEARAAVAVARGSLLPHLAAGGTYTRNSEEVKLALPLGPQPVTFTLQPKEQLAGQLALTQAILAPEGWFAVSAAGAGARAADASAEAVRAEVRFGVSQAYYGAAAAQQVVAIQERQLALAEAHARDARVQLEAGTQPRIALLRAEMERARVAQDLERARNGLAVAKSALAALLGRRDAADFELAPPPAPALPADLAGLEDEALRRRPELRAAEAGVEAAAAGRRAVTSRYLPAVGAFGQATWADPAGLTGKQQTWAAGVSLSWTLLDGGAREGERRRAGARVAEAEAGLAAAAIRTRDDVRRARLALASARANLVKAEEQVALARENQRLVETAFRVGQSSSLEATDANAALATAELAAASERLEAELAALRLLRAVGA